MAKLKPAPDQTTLPGMVLDPQTKLPLRAKSESESKNGSPNAADDNGPSNLNRPVKVTVPNFADPKRPKTCLEVDFPIVPVNALSQLEGNAGKPIYQMSKWWARRRSSVFRAMLIAAATQAPIRKAKDGSPILNAEGMPLPDEEEAARAVWDLYYANHQKAGNFKHLTVLDCFMGGGTTLVEGSRLGFRPSGVDLNPVAWFVVKNELACTAPDEVRRFFDEIETEVKPIVQPFYVTECPRGHVGKWFHIGSTGDPADDQLMPEDFDPISLSSELRRDYRYEGPEVVYTFWAKHGPCARPGCGHRTPVFRSPVIAEKELGVKYIALTCKKCKCEFHAELGAARMAPGSQRVVLDNEYPFTELSQPFALRLKQYNDGKKDDKKRRAAELFASLEDELGLRCPKCHSFAGEFLRDVLNHHRQAATSKAIDKKHLKIQPPRNSTKSVFAYLLIDPEWVKGCPGNIGENLLGGFSEADTETTSRWYESRLENLRFIEVRGRIKLDEDTSDVETTNDVSVPESAEGSLTEDDSDEIAEEEQVERKKYGLPRYIQLADGRQIDTRNGTVPAKSTFTCQRCGNRSDILQAVKQSNAEYRKSGMQREETECSSCVATELNYHTPPVAPYAIQGFCPCCKKEGHVYDGRFFSAFAHSDMNRLIASEREWAAKATTTLNGFWPSQAIPHALETHVRKPLGAWGYNRFWKMFLPRQLFVLSTLLKRITEVENYSDEVRFQALGAFQQYLRNMNQFCIWNIQADKTEPFLAHPNYHPKQTFVEGSFSSHLGRGNWKSCTESVVEGLNWLRKPTEPFLPHDSSSSQWLEVDDPVRTSDCTIHCQSATDLAPIAVDQGFDLVITDPPFGYNLGYADMADFFYVWLALALKKYFPEYFTADYTPKTLEAITNVALHPDERSPEEKADGARPTADAFYQTILTECWRQCNSLMKAGGILAFTFHHAADEPWIQVLESLFDAGFCLEATFPVKNDETKGEGSKPGTFGSQKTEYDILHVCTKRASDTEPVSWPKMRKWVRAEIDRMRGLVEQYQRRALSEGDIRVIMRGKALEFYSRHYGQVFTAENEPMPLSHALLGINQLLDEQGDSQHEQPPSVVQPIAYQFLRLFRNRSVLSRDDVSKSLRGTGVLPREIVGRGWIEERSKKVFPAPIRQRFEHFRKRPRKEMKNEIDQAHFLIGGAFPNSGVNLEQELTKDTWMVRRSVDAVLEWYAKVAPDETIRDAAGLARTILQQTLEKLRQQPMELDRQLKLFNDWDESV